MNGSLYRPWKEDYRLWGLLFWGMENSVYVISTTGKINMTMEEER